MEKMVLWTLLLITVLSNVMSQQALQDCKLDLVILLDRSGSITDVNLGNSATDWVAVKNFVKSLVDRFTIGPNNAQIALVTFSTGTNLEFPLGTSKSEMLSRIDQISDPDGWTSTARALRDANQILTGDRSDAGNVVFMLTDGNPTKALDGTERTSQNRQAIRNESINEADFLRPKVKAIFTVGVGNRVSDEVLTAIAGGATNYKKVDQFSSLMSQLESILATTCSLVSTTTTQAPVSDCNLDLGILMDMSGSITDPNGQNSQNWQSMKEFVRGVIQNFGNIGPNGAQIGLITFNQKPQTRFTFNDALSQSAMVNVVNNLVHDGGWTNTSGGLKTARNTLFNGQGMDRQNAKNVLILITDGRPTKGIPLSNGTLLEVPDSDNSPLGQSRRNILYNQTKSWANILKNEGTSILSVGVTSSIDEQLLKEVSGSSENYFFVQQFSQLMNQIQALLTQACNLVSTTTTTTTTTTTRPTTTTPTANPISDCNLDLGILMDMSGSITDPNGQNSQNWQSMKDFVRGVIQNFGNIGPNGAQIGLITFNQNPQTRFTFNDALSQSAMVNVVNNLVHEGGWTNTSGGLKTARNTLFNSQGMDRQNAKNVLILITDGRPTKGIPLSNGTLLEVPDSDNSPLGQSRRNILYNQTKSWANILKNEGTSILSVGVTSSIDEQLLKEVSGSTENYFFVQQFSQLMNQIQALLTQACNLVSTTTTTTTTTRPTTTTTIANPISDCNLDLGILMDMSGSITDPNGQNSQNWQSMKDFVRGVIQNFGNIGPNGAQIGLITFNQNPQTRFTFNDALSQSAMVNVVNNLVHEGGWTNTSGGLKTARNTLFNSQGMDRRNAKNVLILITDGRPTKGIPLSNGTLLEVPDSDNTPLGQSRRNILYNQTKSWANILKNEGTSILSVGVTSSIDEQLLKEVSGSTENYFFVQQFSQLMNQIQALLTQACNLVSTTTTTTTTTRPTTTTTIANPISDCNLDLGILMDMSGSITDPNGQNSQNWQSMKDFVRGVIQNFGNIGPNGAQIGLITFNQNPQTRFTFNDALSQSAMVNVVNNLVHEGGWTNTSGGLKTARNTLFNSQGMDRRNAKNVLILITDGRPTKGIPLSNGTLLEVPDSDNTPLGQSRRNILYNQTKSWANILKNEGTSILSVGVTSSIDEQLLKEVSGSTENYFFVQQFSQLMNQIQALLTQACNLVSTTTTTTTTTRPTTTTTIANPISDCNLDLGILMDMSGSITDPNGQNSQNWQSMKDFVRGVIQNFGNIGPNGAQIGLITFNQNPQTRFTFNDALSQSAMVNVVNNLVHEGGWTNTSGGLKTARNTLFNSQGMDRRNAKNVLILITDGRPTKGIPLSNGTLLEVPDSDNTPLGQSRRNILYNQTKSWANILKNEGTSILSVGVTSSIDEQLLKEVSGSTENYFFVQQFSQLMNQIQALLTQACNLVSTTTTTTTTTTTRPTTTTTIANPISDCNLDLGILMDMSGSITDPNGQNSQNWQSMKDFVRGVIQNFGNIGPNGAQIGLITFNHQTKAQFTFNDSLSQNRMVNVVNNLIHEGGWTNTSGGLRLAREELFSPKGKDRPNAKNVLILITDGRPTKGLPLNNGTLLEVPDTDKTALGQLRRNILNNQTRIEANILKNESTSILCVAVTNSVDENLLKEIAGSSGNYFFVQQFSQLMNQLQAILRQTCSLATTPAPTPTPIDCNIDMTLLMDMSGSITDPDRSNMQNWESMKGFVRGVVNYFNNIGPSGTQFSLVTFNNNPTVQYDFTTQWSKSQMISYIDNLIHDGGWTNTSGALWTARNKIFTPQGNDRSSAPNLLLVLTDGRPTMGLPLSNGSLISVPDNDNTTAGLEKRGILFNQTKKEGTMLKNAGTNILTVGVTDAIDKTLLMELASAPEDFFFVSEFSQLMNQVETILLRSCKTTTTTSTTTTSTTTTTTPAPTPARTCKVDLAILIDASGSILKAQGGQQNWVDVQNFVRNFVNGLTLLGIQDAHLSIICFSNAAELVLPLKPMNIKEIEQTIQQMKNKDGYTATADALHVARTQVFTGNANDGDRPDAPNYLLMLTDGKPSAAMDGTTKEDTDNSPIMINKFNREVIDMATGLTTDGTMLLAVGITNNVNDTLMRMVVTNPDDYYTVQQFAQLESKVQTLVQRTCDATTTTTTTTTTPAPTTTPPLGVCTIDLVILVDSSGSIVSGSQGTTNWQSTVNFVADLITSLSSQGITNARVAVVCFSMSIKRVNPANNYSDLTQLVSVVKGMRNKGSYTATAGALKEAQKLLAEINTEVSRQSISDVVLLITDGFPTFNLANQTMDAPINNATRQSFYNEVKAEAERLKTGKATILGFGITNKTDDALMKEVVTSKDGYFMVDQFSQLKSQIQNVNQQACGPTTAPPACVIDIVIAVDASGSIGTNNWELVKSFLIELVRSLGNVGSSGANVAIVTFSNEVRVPVALGTMSLSNIETAINNLAYMNSYTSTAGALQQTRTIFSQLENRDNAPDYLILMTDGYPTQALNGTRMDQGMETQLKTFLNNEVRAQAQLLKNQGVRIIGFGVTQNVDETLMRQIVTTANSDYFKVDQFSQLQQQIQNLNQRACTPTTGDCPVDVALLIDNSGSVSNQNGLPDVKSFLNNIITQLYTKDPSVQISMVEFSTDTMLKFNLGQYNQSRMMSDINGIKNTQGWTATASALQIAKDQVFTGQGGDRTGAANVIILVTDGQPTSDLSGKQVERTAASMTERNRLDNEVIVLAEALRNRGVTILPVAVTSEANITLLERVSALNVLNVSMFSELNNQLSTIIDSTCQVGVCSIDLAILVDSSGSITADNWEVVKTFLGNLTTALGQIGGVNGANVAIINFSNGAQLVTSLGDSSSTIKNKIKTLEYKNSWTQTVAALDLTMNRVFNGTGGDRSTVPNTLLLLTDGRPSMSRDGEITVLDNANSSTDQAKRKVIEEEVFLKAKALRDQGVRFIGVGVTDLVDAAFMRTLVTDSSRDYIMVSQFNELENELNSIRQQACTSSP